MTSELTYSSIWLAVAAILGGLSLLAIGGEMLISGAARLAARSGMRPLLIGLTVVAFGTSMPELFVSLAAAWSGHADIAVGNVVGSNIANIGLVLALVAAFYPLRAGLGAMRLEMAIFFAVTLLLVLIAYSGFFHRVYGLFLILGLCGYTWHAYRQARKPQAKNGDGRPPRRPGQGLASILGLVIGGLLLLYLGSDFFIGGAVDVARYFLIPELVIGLTLAAVGTSLPELASSFSAGRRGEGDLLIGNIVGSNLFNIMMVLGGTALVKPFAVSTQVLARDLPVMLAFSAVLLLFLALGKAITRSTSGLLLVGYLVYIGFLY